MSDDKRVGKRAIRGRGSKDNTGTHSVSQAWEMFFYAKSGEGLRRRTLEDYQRHFRYLSAWLSEAHPEIAYVTEISASTLREYVYYLSHEKPRYDGHPYKSEEEKRRKGLAPGAVNVRLTTLKALFRWLYSEEIIARNPAQNLKKQKVDEDAIGAFTDDQVDRLLSQPTQKTYPGISVFLPWDCGNNVHSSL